MPEDAVDPVALEPRDSLPVQEPPEIAAVPLLLANEKIECRKEVGVVRRQRR